MAWKPCRLGGVAHRLFLGKIQYSAHRNLRNMSTIQTRNFPTLRKLRPPPPRVFIKLNTDLYAEPYSISQKEAELITEGDSEAQIRLQEIQLNLYLLRDKGVELPNTLTVEEFKDLMRMGPNEINQWLSRCCIRRMCEERTAPEKRLMNNLNRELRLRNQKRLETEPDSYLSYELFLNSLILPVFKTSISRLNNFNLSKALLFGQSIVFDCSFDTYMNELDLKQAAYDIHCCIKSIRKNRRPFAIHLCNVKSDSRLMHHIKKYNPAIGYDLPVKVHDCSYLNLFEREQIVYLTPYSNKEVEYHPDDVYILGALGGTSEPISLRKAKFEGVRYARLPIGFQQLIQGDATLSLHETIKVLLSKKNTGKWIHIHQLYAK